MGDTLRGLLLNAYAFGVVGTIALYASIASFIGAVVLLLLAALGFRHARAVAVLKRAWAVSNRPQPKEPERMGTLASGGPWYVPGASRQRISDVSPKHRMGEGNRRERWRPAMPHPLDPTARSGGLFD